MWYLAISIVLAVGTAFYQSRKFIDDRTPTEQEIYGPPEDPAGFVNSTNSIIQKFEDILGGIDIKTWIILAGAVFLFNKTSKPKYNKYR